MRHSAVWSAVNMLAEMVSRLPVDEFRRIPGERPVEVALSPIIAAPSEEVSASNWRRQLLVSLLTRGNALALYQDFDRMGFPTGADVVHPDEVGQRLEDGRVAWTWRGKDLVPGKYLHAAAYVVPGSPVGLSPILYLAETIGLGLAARDFAAHFFGSGGHPSGLLTNDMDLGVDGGSRIEEAKRRFEESVRSRGVAAMAHGWRYQPISVTPEESQFLDTMQANGATIATIYGLRPEDLGYASGGSSLTYANIEQRQLDRLMYPVAQWITLVEEHLGKMLAPDRFVKLNTGGFLRTDLMTRYSAHDKAIRAGFLNRNEARALEDLPPIPEGDEYLWPPGRAFAIPSDQEM